MKLLALLLVTLAPCTPIVVCPVEPTPVPEREYLPLRIVQAEFITEAHWMACYGEPPTIPDLGCVRTLEVHSDEIRCLAQAAEAYQWCVMAQACHGTDQACQDAYHDEQARCGDTDWALVLRPCEE